MGIKVAKNVFRIGNVLEMALVEQQATPVTECQCSPAELIVDRQIQKKIPLSETQLVGGGPTLAKKRYGIRMHYGSHYNRMLDSCHLFQSPAKFWLKTVMLMG